MATKDSTRTIEAHDTAVSRRRNEKARRMEQMLADRALARLIREVNGR